MEVGRLSPRMGDDLKAISPETRLVPLSGFQFDSQCPPGGIESLEVGWNFLLSFFNVFFNQCVLLWVIMSLETLTTFLLFKVFCFFQCGF